MLGVAQELEVRLALGINADTAAQSIAIEGTACTLLAKVARHGRGQLLESDGGAPQPEARRDRRQVGGNEQVGLQSFDRSRRAAQRENHIG